MGLNLGQAPNLEKDFVCYTWQVVSIAEYGKHSVVIYYTKDEKVFKEKESHVATKYKKIVRHTWLDRLMDNMFDWKITEAVRKINEKLQKEQRNRMETSAVAAIAHNNHACPSPTKCKRPKTTAVGHPEPPKGPDIVTRPY